jgi:uncharacterized surface protein with fasciclin (FAS1) repeats
MFDSGFLCNTRSSSMPRSYIVTLAAGMILPAALGNVASAEAVQKDIVETAVAAEFTTLVKAAQAAGLVETLKGKGPFTVFAPTNKAFAAVPKARLEALLKDKKALTAVLTYHVVPGKVTAADVVKLNSAKTVQGQNLRIVAKDGKVRVNDANVIKADIVCSNGVIHVVDTVLLPDMARAAAVQIIDETLGRSGGPAGAETSAAALKTAAEKVLELAPGNALVREMLTDAMAEQTSPRESTSSSASLHDALRGAAEILRFEPTIEARAPAGFPEPTPVGQIEVKSYPAHRLARTRIASAAANDQAFFTLFRHITGREIAMTVPVEMTYGKDNNSRAHPQAMAFFYESQAVGEIGQHGEVNVADVPAATVVSLGMRGDYTDDALSHAQRLLQNWLKEHEDRFEAQGSLRVLGFNSPMVPVAERFFEVQIPAQDKGAAQ